ncbi:MAG: ABC transporter ATP-binding protein/permease [Selenomonadaceae bacterium]|nr:ABC transporter ATP-binding protein/permease [Selenomonadaceae bacterium]
MKQNLFKGFWNLFRGYWSSEEKFKARGLLSIVIALNFAMVYLLVQLNDWYNEFYNSLQNYQSELFWPLIGKFTALAFIYIMIAVYAIYLRQMLQLKWRTWMTNQYLNSWMNKQVYYRLQLSEGATDNPDQRISEDINQFVALTLQLLIGFLKQITTLAAFGVVLWNLSGEFNLNLGGFEFVIYGYMFWFSLIYSGIGTFLAHKVGRKLIGLNFDQQKYEADFRFNMMRVRENAESIAFYRGESAEIEGFLEKFSNVIKNYWALMKKTKQLNFYVNGYGQLAIIVPLIMAAPRYFSGAMQLGGLMQTISAFGRVQDALSYFVDSYDTIANLAAVVNRLAGFTEHVEEAIEIKDGIKRETSTEKKLSLNNLTIKLPDNKILIKDLNLELPQSKRLLVSGPSGCGKSTLLRTLAGIWFYATGSVTLPINSKILFLPQRPYLPLGTLKRALLYPSTETRSNEELIDALKLVDLPDLTNKLDVEDDWSRILSLGEQQRLAFARVILTAPEFLFLDEATSALDEPREEEMYDLLQKTFPNLTIISVGHRSTLNKKHNLMLAITSADNYNINVIEN